MRFGVEILDRPAGMMHPAGFAAIEEIVDAAVEAERLGYDDAGGKRSPQHETISSARCVSCARHGPHQTTAL
jgi:hypothetical protein